MLISEHPNSYIGRQRFQREEAPRHERTREAEIDPIETRFILDAVEDSAEPIRIVRVVNAVARRFEYENPGDRTAKKIELLRRIGHLIRCGRLERACPKRGGFF